MSFLIDSNIFIYATRPDDNISSEFLKSTKSFCYSKITLIEVLGVKGLSRDLENDLRILFSKGYTLDVSDNVVSKAIELRKIKKMTLGDSIIAATAMVYQKQIVTRDVDGFNNIEGLEVYNPYKA
ncbi:MAG: type II toxin-antitoxin system VapC family toxin [Candidatus Brocadiales bacterium]